MPQRPTQRQIDEARAFVESRVSVQQYVQNTLYDDFTEAARRIALIVLKYKSRNVKLRFSGASNMAMEVDEVIKWLEFRVYSYLHVYSVPEEEESDEKAQEIEKEATGEYYGATFDERMDLYMSRFIAALKDAGIDDIDDADEEAIFDIIMEENESNIKRMLLLLANTVAFGWSLWQKKNAEEEGLKYFYVLNGSRPCDFCKDMEGLHPIDDAIPPYHVHCQCSVVYL